LRTPPTGASLTAHHLKEFPRMQIEIEYCGM